MKKRKGSVVLKITDSDTERSGTMMLNKDRMTFWAEVFNQDGVPSYHESKDGDVVERWLRAELRKAPADLILSWLPVMKVVVSKGATQYGYGEKDNSAGVGLMLTRFYLALTPDNKEWRKLEWEQAHDGSRACVPDALRYKTSTNFATGPGETNTVFDSRHNVARVFTLPHVNTRGNGGPEYTMAWTPEGWKGLLAVMEAIKGAHEAIEEIVGTDKGMAMLVDVGLGKIPLRLGAGA